MAGINVEDVTGRESKMAGNVFKQIENERGFSRA